MRSEADRADAVFQSASWFQLLASQGFEKPAEPLVLPLGPPAGGACLHLMAGDGGRGVQALSNYYTGLFGPVGPVADLGHDDWLRAVQSVRATAAPVRWNLHPLSEKAAWSLDLERSLRRCGYWTDRYFCFGNWFQPVPPGGFAVYWAARPSALRNTVARARKRLDKQGDWRLEIVTQPGPALAGAIEAYTAVYSRSWKTPEPNPLFMPSLIRLAAEQGWLRLGLVWVGGAPVAAQLWLVAGGKANIFKLAYVQGQEKLSAGSVLTAELMRHVMDVDRVGEVDFLSGDDAYKADWMAQRRERVGLVAFDQRHWRGWLAALRHRLGRWRRAWRQG
jgi:CelD/BcsL family acetyltransferase involved in cellulose biosynthesis